MNALDWPSPTQNLFQLLSLHYVASVVFIVPGECLLEKGLPNVFLPKWKKSLLSGSLYYGAKPGKVC